MRILLIALALLTAAQSSPPDPALPKLGKDARTLQGRQLAATISQSALHAAPGESITLYADIAPKPKMHVYAPEQTGGYIRIELLLDDDAAVVEKAPVFPKASDYYFEPLNETFKVFDAPFRIRQDVVIRSTPELRKRAAAKEALTLTGTLRYQACDDQVCYRPDQVKLTWTIGLQPPARR